MAEQNKGAASRLLASKGEDTRRARRPVQSTYVSNDAEGPDWGSIIWNAIQAAADEASGAFERYGRRSGAQRDASLAMLNQAVDPGTDPLTGAGMKALGLAGLVTHPLAVFPTGDEWRERAANAGNTGRVGQAIAGALGDLPSIVDPHLLAGGGALAMAPLVGKMAKPSAAAVRVLPTDVTGYSRGESFGTKLLKVDDVPQAAADLSILGDTVYINNIETLEGSRRSGLASKLLDDIFAEFSDKKIAVTNMTDDGGQFFRKKYNIDEDGYLSRK